MLMTILLNPVDYICLVSSKSSHIVVLRFILAYQKNVKFNK